MPPIQAANGGRHADRTDTEQELLTRLEQVVDWYAITQRKPKSRAMTAAIDLLTKRKAEFDSVPHEEPLIPRSAH